MMANAAMISSVRQKYEALAPLLHERARRRWAACEALALGRGGIALVASATGLSCPPIRKGIAEVHAGPDADALDTRVRRPGGGRHPLTATDRSLLRDLQRLV